MRKNNKAFTLAEVLITLAVLGVVAAITIPSIMLQKDKQAWAVQLNKTYATLENARRLTAIDYGGDISELFSSADVTTGNVALQAFAAHLNIVKNCGESTGCWYDNIKNLDGTLYNDDGLFETHYDGSHGKAVLANGTAIKINGDDSSCTTNNSNYPYSPKAYEHWCGYIWVDVNGKKAPNTIGRDVFQFDITRDGIYPRGLRYSEASINSSCSNSSSGAYCAAKVIKEGAMNY